MKKATLLTFACLASTLAAPGISGSEEFLLYTPKPSAGSEVPASPAQGVLVKKVKVKRGDTLARLSREHLGEASLYPQMLVFNEIGNPDLIYAGADLLIPVPPGREAAGRKAVHGARTAHGAKKATHGKRGKKHHRRHAAATAAATAGAPAAPVAAPVAAGGEKGSFERARRAYAARNYQKAQALFGDFLKAYPHSSLAPDASLYRADCFLHLSGQ